MIPFKVGDKVRKSSGYEFTGTVRAVFTNSAGEIRTVVEHDVSVGMLHIFNPTQLVFQ